MKVLKIDSNKAYYSCDGDNYNSIVDINKDDILKILFFICDNDVEFDECLKDENINSDVERILYKNIYDKLKGFNDNKENLKQVIESDVLTYINKYSE